MSDIEALLDRIEATPGGVTQPHEGPRPRMEPHFLAAWLKALRSGNYKQRQGRLRWRDAFCCLGVACDVLDPDGWVGSCHQGMLFTPSSEVRRQGPGGMLIYARGYAVAIQTLNDTVGLSFDEIADLIEYSEAQP